MGWFTRVKRESGWMALSLASGRLQYALGQGTGNGSASVRAMGSLPAEDPDAVHRAVKELQLDRFACSTLLDSSEYQLLMVEAPNVPQAELKSAIRWRVKDMIDTHVDDTTIDVLDIPPDPGATGRAHMMLAVAAPNEIIQRTVDRYIAAQIPLSVIEIPETAQRNISAMYEEGARGVALLHLAPGSGLLTISCRQELHFARRIDIGLTQLTDGSAGESNEGLNRLVLELQRTFDHFDRQFRHVSVTRLLVGPEPGDSGIVGHLASSLDVQVESLRLADIVKYAPGLEVGREIEWQLFHLIGASLRHEAKAL